MKPKDIAKLHAKLFLKGHYEDSSVAESSYLLDCEMQGIDVYSDEVSEGFEMVSSLIISMAERELEDGFGNKINLTKH